MATEELAAPKDGDWTLYRRLLGYVRPYWLLFTVSVLAFLLAAAAEGYFAQLFGELIDTWGTDDMNVALAIPALMFAAAIARAFGAIVGESLLSMVSFNVVYNLRVQLFDQLLRLPSSYFDASAQGHLVSRITFNVAQLRDTGTDALKSIVQDGIKIFVYFGWMLLISAKLTFIFVASVPLLAVVVVFASGRFRRIAGRIQDSMGSVTHVASEAVNGYRVVKIFGGEAYEQRRFHRSARVNRQQNLKMAVTKVLSTQVNEVIVAAAISALVAVLFTTGVGGELTAGAMVQFLTLAGLLARPIRKLTEVNAKLQRGLAAAEDVFSQLDEAEEVDGGAAVLSRASGRIEFKNVSFSYARGNAAVLNNFSLTIEQGQTVALVGKSGGGKSTIAALIPRFYEVDSGEILLDGQPIKSYTLRSLRDQIALVNQQVTLFNDTLEKNIAYGVLEDASEAKIREAIIRAHADVFVDELPEGLQTVVGDDGVLLSGGQRQRVAIARALLKDAPILILDEATSALDTESERHIQAALEEVMRGRTTLVIAHRLSTIESADVIVVMDEGGIAEQGDHATLLAKGGAYRALYDAQFEDSPGTAPKKPKKKANKTRQTAAKLPRVPGPSATRLQDGWYEGSPWLQSLRPFAWLFGRVAARRKQKILTDGAAWRAPVPVIVVGNITVGGTGKTPLVVSLCERLATHGLRAGVVSRGYGRRSKSVSLVDPNGSPEAFGDEPLLIAARTGVPVCVGDDRGEAVRALLDQHAVDIIIADDGLQHYGLARDIEIAVVDGSRGLGNGQLLPAGPLREPAERLTEVDWVVANGRGFEGADVVMQLTPTAFVRLLDGHRVALDYFKPGTLVHAVAGIGNPARFAATLKELGLEPALVALADHHEFKGSEVTFEDDAPVIVTEKDATKLRQLAVEGGLAAAGDVWYLEVAAEFPESAWSAFDRLVAGLGVRPVEQKAVVDG